MGPSVMRRCGQIGRGGDIFGVARIDSALDAAVSIGRCTIQKWEEGTSEECSGVIDF